MNDEQAKRAALVLYKGRHGVFCHIAADQTIGASLRMYGEWAEEELFLLSHLVREGDVVVDVGANIGTHTIAFARFVGNTGQVIAIDAQFLAFRLLSFNIVLNGAHNVVPINALAERTNSLKMVSDLESGENLGAMSFANVDFDRVDTQQPLRPLPAIAIDSLMLRQCDLIKIDVEGMELHVLSGAMETLSRYRPFVYFEQTSASNLAEISALFFTLGYDLFWHVARPFNTANFHGATDNIFGTAVEVNILARPREKLLPEAIKPVTAHPLTSALYDPPLTVIDPLAWSLPASTHARLAPPPAYQPGGLFASLHADLEMLQQRFDALAEDRKKAQDIMEFQLRQLEELRGKAG